MESQGKLGMLLIVLDQAAITSLQNIWTQPAQYLLDDIHSIQRLKPKHTCLQLLLNEYQVMEIEGNEFAAKYA